MECFKLENLTFAYPGRENPALCDINLCIEKGDFITVCGKSGCGKTTLLRLLKPSLAPFGQIGGNIFFNGKHISEMTQREHTAKIGFVMQNPESQIVTDKVCHELAFGLESLGYSTSEIRAKVSEMASFFGIQTWFHKKTNELSGGQKQLLNLASVMLMQPDVIILDEPCGQLDPISANKFINMLEKINVELGITVIIAEHRLDGVLSISNRVIVMDKGKILTDTSPKKVGKILKDISHEMYLALPATMRIYGDVVNGDIYPITVSQGREWINEYSQCNSVEDIPCKAYNDDFSDAVIHIKDAYFRYERNLPDVIKGLNLKVEKGEILAVVGGNGTGKTTMLSLISGVNKPYRGEVSIYDKKLDDIKNLYKDLLGVLPQNPQTLFSKKSVYLELSDMISSDGLTSNEKEKQISDVAKLCRISDILEAHPYDISGGEQQRVALAKILLLNPDILLLDEPTKGMDEHFKIIFASVLNDLKSKGKTIILVSHDIEFCAEFSDRCVMFFDGDITSSGAPREFFAGKAFYTTTANKMVRHILPNAVLAKDVISACGGKVTKPISTSKPEIQVSKNVESLNELSTINNTQNKRTSFVKIICSAVFALLFVITHLMQKGYNFGMSEKVLSAITYLNAKIQLLNILSIIFAALCISCLIPHKINSGLNVRNDEKNIKQNIIALIFVLFVIPLTVLSGWIFLDDRKYYVISILVILEILVPIFMTFEGSKPKTRKLVLISSMCAIAVAGRIVFYTFPQFKPVMALVIISGLCFGGETGFLIGAVTAFVSNFFFGQSPITPWQMFGFGIVGYLFGALFARFTFMKNKIIISILGALATIFIYGFILNTASVILWQSEPTFEMFVVAYIGGLPFDVVHAVSTAAFLYLLYEPISEKIERIKTKYGLN